jgi:hypothetical protein
MNVSHAFTASNISHIHNHRAPTDNNESVLLGGIERTGLGKLKWNDLPEYLKQRIRRAYKEDYDNFYPNSPSLFS